MGRLGALAFFALAVACSGGPPRPAAPPAVRAPRAQPAQDEWAPLAWEDRHDVMTFAVLPTMGRLFQHFRASAAPDLTCGACHGADGERIGYRMPNALPAVDPAMRADASPMARFMIEEVTPTMSELLGKEITCASCHRAR